MKKTLFFSLVLVFILNSCSRFSRGSKPASQAETMVSDTRSSEELDITKFNARFSYKTYDNFTSNKKLEMKRSIANFFFYNQERILAGAITTRDLIRNRDLDGTTQEEVAWCDFKSEADYKAMKEDLDSFYAPINKTMSESTWDHWCDTHFSKNSDKRTCRKVYDVSHKRLREHLIALYDKIGKNSPDLFTDATKEYRKNYSYIKKHDLRGKIGSEFNVYNIVDTDMCYNATTVITEESSYWDFWDLYEANGKEKHKPAYVIAAPKKIDSIHSMEMEFGFNLDAERKILEDNGSYIQIKFKTTDEEFKATFVYSRDNIEVKEYDDACTPLPGAESCKALEVDFSDDCGRVKFMGSLDFFPDKVVLVYPHILFRNHRSAYSNPQCQYNTSKVPMSVGINVPLSSVLPKGTLQKTIHDGEKWMELFKPEPGETIQMKEIK